ncbi:MAG: hypothetical protein PHS45_03600 [Bacilli bacterium]|nr:hypothetical protein [Bacilli bacterium]
MKIELIDDNKTVLFLNKLILKNFNVDNPNYWEEYIKKLIINLRDNYDLKLNGDYSAKVYINNIYGIIIELIKLDDYFSFSDDIVDMRILFNLDSNILYEVDDYFHIDYLGNNIDKYYYDSKYYYKIKTIDDKNLIRLSDFSKVIYGSKAEEVLKKAIKIK